MYSDAIPCIEWAILLQVGLIQGNHVLSKYPKAWFEGAVCKACDVFKFEARGRLLDFDILISNQPLQLLLVLYAPLLKPLLWFIFDCLLLYLRFVSLLLVHLRKGYFFVYVNSFTIFVHFEVTVVLNGVSERQTIVELDSWDLVRLEKVADFSKFKIIIWSESLLLAIVIILLLLIFESIHFININLYWLTHLFLLHPPLVLQPPHSTLYHYALNLVLFILFTRTFRIRGYIVPASILLEEFILLVQVLILWCFVRKHLIVQSRLIILFTLTLELAFLVPIWAAAAETVNWIPPIKLEIIEWRLT